MVVLSSFPPPAEGVRLKQENTQAVVQDKSLGNGVLYVAESRLSWRAVDGTGFSLEYPAISIHAVSKDTSSFPHECVYLMVDGDIGQGDGTNSGSDSSGDDENSTKVSEIRFVPEDSSALDLIYRAMCDCQVLHPDQNDSLSDAGEDDEEGFYEDDEEDLTPQGEDMLHRMEAMLAAGDDGIERDHEQPAVGGLTNGGDGAAGPNEPMDTEQFDDAD